MQMAACLRRGRPPRPDTVAALHVPDYQDAWPDWPGIWKFLWLPGRNFRVPAGVDQMSAYEAQTYQATHGGKNTAI